MNVVVVSAFEAGTHWAHAINTVEMAGAFASLGHRVTLVCRRPAAGRVDEAALRAGYGVADPLAWIQLPAHIGPRRLGEHWPFALLALPAALRARADLIYARSYVFPWLASRVGIPTVAESHAHPGEASPAFRRLVAASRHAAFRLWVTISPRLAQHYASLGVPQPKLAVLPDAVDLRRFARPRELPPSPYATERPVVAYVGHLYDYKGIPAVLDAAGRLPGIAFHLVGGWPRDVATQERRVRERGLANVTLHGAVPHAEVPRYLWHADALLLPPSARHPSAAWTSPLKLGEYLASETVVVASAIPALRDLVSDEQVRFVAPDDGGALAEGIADALGARACSAARVRAGAARARQLSYARRASAVLERLEGAPVPASAPRISARRA